MNLVNFGYTEIKYNGHFLETTIPTLWEYEMIKSLRY